MLHLHSSHIARDFHQQCLICITHVSINMLTLPFQHCMHRKQFQICSIYTRKSCQSCPSAPSTNCCLLQGCMTNNFTCILQQVLYYDMDCFPPYDINTLLCDACIYMLTSIRTSSNCNHKQCTLIL